MLALTMVLTIFAILVVRVASVSFWGSLGTPDTCSRPGQGGHRGQQAHTGGGGTWLRQVGRQVGTVLVALLALAALSFSLDHHLLWKTASDSGAHASPAGGRAGGVGGVLRGKVAVVLDGSRGVGFQVTRALQALGATVVMACPNRDTCARTTTALAGDFTPADGAWALTPMKLNMCSLSSIRAFAAAVADKYERVDMLVLDSTTSCASNTTLFSSSPGASRRVGDGSACPQTFVAHTALLRWLRPLLVPSASPVSPAATTPGSRDTAIIVGVTGPLHWLAGVEDTSQDVPGGGGGGGGGVEEEANLRTVVGVLWQQQLEAAVGRAPYEALGRLLFPSELQRQWSVRSRHLSSPKTAPQDVRVAAVGLGVVRSWPGIEGLSGVGEMGGEGGVDALVGAEWWLSSALREVAKDGVWAQVGAWFHLAELRHVALLHWGVGWLGFDRWSRVLGVCAQLWRVCEGVVIRPSSVAARPILRALLHPPPAGDAPGPAFGSGGREDAVFVDAQGRCGS